MVSLVRVTVGFATVTLLVETSEKLPAASTAYTLYVPGVKPLAGISVLVFADSIVTLFHVLSDALVISVTLSTETLVFTIYAVPVSVLLTDAFSEIVIVADVTLAVGS